MIKIMTFNIRCDLVIDFKNRWKHRKDIVFNVINNYDCDIIGLQEVTEDMLKDIKDSISEYNIIGDPRTKKLFVERNDILVSKRHKIREYKTFWLSDKPDKVGSSIWYSLFPRICTTAIVDLDNGESVRVCNSHLDCLLPKAREYGMNKLIEFIVAEQKKEELPIVMMGDFNATPNSKLIKKLSQEKVHNKRFVAVQEVNKELYTKSTMSMFKGHENGLHIDYIFVSDDIEIQDADIIKYNINGKYPSDHYPLIANIRIGRGNKG